MTDQTTGGPRSDPTDPQLRDLSAFAALCLTTRGSYWKLSGALGRLRARMGDLGLTPAGPAFGIFYDDPETVPDEETRYTLGYPLDTAEAEDAESRLGAASRRDAGEGDVGSGDRFTVERFPDETVASLEHEGPAAESGSVYARLEAWLTEQGLEAQGPPREIYLAEPGTLGKGLLHALIHQPVTRRPAAPPA